MRTPSFRYMGGKARLRKWLLSHFPKTGNRYIEMFCGLGNVFWQARKDLAFSSWTLCDKTTEFLQAVLDVDLDCLPEICTKEMFLQYKVNPCQIGRLIENRVSFGGKGFKAGFDAGDPSHPPYNGSLYREQVTEARRLLQGVQLVQGSWETFPYDSLSSDDFLYFDPPYYGTKASYTNIDHEAFVETVNKLKCRWAVSGYDNLLYQEKLMFTRKEQKVRGSELKGCNSRQKESVVETLWLNYQNS